jgi:hypothetical protein
VAVAADSPAAAAEKVRGETCDRQRRKAKSAILALLQGVELEADDLDEIDQVVHERQRALATRRRSTPEVPDSAASRTAFRVGNQRFAAEIADYWLEQVSCLRRGTICSTRRTNWQRVSEFPARNRRNTRATPSAQMEEATVGAGWRGPLTICSKR